MSIELVTCRHIYARWLLVAAIGYLHNQQESTSMSRKSHWGLRSAIRSQRPETLGSDKISPAGDHLERLALLVANGEAPLPTELSPAELHALLQEVARHRRARLIHYIARAIAADIHSQSNNTKEL